MGAMHMAWCMMTDEEGTKVGDDNKKEGSHTEVTCTEIGEHFRSIDQGKQ
jgi:hypothetical protein